MGLIAEKTLKNSPQKISSLEKDAFMCIKAEKQGAKTSEKPCFGCLLWALALCWPLAGHPNYWQKQLGEVSLHVVAYIVCANG